MLVRIAVRLKVNRTLVLKFVSDESDLHHGCVMVNYLKLNLCLVDNNFVHFYWRLL